MFDELFDIAMRLAFRCLEMSSDNILVFDAVHYDFYSLGTYSAGCVVERTGK